MHLLAEAELVEVLKHVYKPIVPTCVDLKSTIMKDDCSFILFQ